MLFPISPAFGLGEGVAIQNSGASAAPCWPVKPGVLRLTTTSPVEQSEIPSWVRSLPPWASHTLIYTHVACDLKSFGPPFWDKRRGVQGRGKGSRCIICGYRCKIKMWGLLGLGRDFPLSPSLLVVSKHPLNPSSFWGNFLNPDHAQLVATGQKWSICREVPGAKWAKDLQPQRASLLPSFLPSKYKSQGKTISNPGASE